MSIAADSVVTMTRGAFPALGAKVGVIENEIDLATVSAELVAQGDGVLATGDIIQAINVPQGSVVISAGIEVTETVVGVAALPVGLYPRIPWVVHGLLVRVPLALRLTLLTSCAAP